MRLLFFFSILLTLTSCQYGNTPPHLNHAILSQSISLNNPEIKNCTFHPHSRIAHFPMIHFPENGRYDEILFEKVAKSQFQLLRTIVAYKGNIRVFDEHVVGNDFDEYFLGNLKRGYSQGFYTRAADGIRFPYSERYKTAFALFGNGIPTHYEYLTQAQKRYIFDIGSSLTLFFLGLLPKIHKVISSGDWDAVKSNLIDPSTGRINSGLPNNRYWTFDFREQKLKEEVLKLYRQAPAGLILIAYGSAHNFSDDFQGYPFQSGTFCVNWLNSNFPIDNPS